MMGHHLTGGGSLYLNCVDTRVECHWLRHIADRLHILANLVWHLLQHFFSKVASSHTLLESDKLDDITSTFPTLSVSQRLVITIELLHHSELLITNTHDDNTCGQVGCLTDEVLNFLHVVNLTICQN